MLYLWQSSSVDIINTKKQVLLNKYDINRPNMYQLYFEHVISTFITLERINKKIILFRSKIICGSWRVNDEYFI